MENNNCYDNYYHQYSQLTNDYIENTREFSKFSYEIDFNNNSMDIENLSMNIFNEMNDEYLSDFNQAKSLKISEYLKQKKKRKFEEELLNLKEKYHLNYNEWKRNDLCFKRLKNLTYNFGKNLINMCIEKKKGNNEIILYSIEGIKKALIDDTSKYFNESFFSSTLEKIFSNPSNKKNKKSNRKLNNNEKIKRVKKLNDPLLNELFDLKFIDLMNIYVYGNKNDIEQYFEIPNLMLFEDFLKSSKFRNESRNINLTDEQFAKIVLKFKMIAYNDHLLEIIPRKITDLKFKKKLQMLEGTNFYDEIKMKYSNIIKINNK